ncbi:MAG: glycosyltransferase family 4 protein [Bacteroidetes bacterium]|nr:glycosyltransferase family 4 protein [Bacteroidota bacterium]
MHILLIHQYFLEKDDGGGSRFNEMVKVWVRGGHQVTVIAGMVHYSTGKKRKKYRGKFIVKEKFDENITLYRSHVSASYNKNFAGRFWAYFSFVFSSIICGLFYARAKYSVVLVSSPPLFVGITGLVLSKLKRIPLVFEIRDLWPESAIDTGILKNKTIIRFAYWFEKLVYKNSKLINALTPAFKTKLIEEKNVPSQKMIMIPNAADFSLSERLVFDVKKFRKEQGFDDKFVIIYVGAHGVANHLILLIEAAELLKNTNVLMLLIGDGMQKKMLKEKARELQNVLFMDPVPKSEIFKYILASDMGISILKKAEAFKAVYSNKTFDYMSCQKPVLMAIDGVSRELVEKADCGVYIEPENPKDFANKVLYCMDNKEKIKEQGMNGYRYARKYFDRNMLAKKYLVEIGKIVGS